MPSAPIVFEIPRKTRWSELVLLVVAAPCFLVGWLLSFVAALSLLPGGIDNAPAPLQAATMLATFGLTLTLAWHWARSRCHFRLTASPTHLESRGGWYRQRMRSDDVETLRVEQDDPRPSTQRLIIEGGGQSWRFHFGVAAWEYAEDLQTLCTNAVLVAPDGTEHLPTATRQPTRALWNQVRSRRRRGWGLVLGSLLPLSWALVVFGLGGWNLLRGQDWSTTLDGIPWEFYLMAATAVVILLIGLLQLQSARRLARRLQAESRFGAELAVTATPVDLSVPHDGSR